jgi:hypothetical protein
LFGTRKGLLLVLTIIGFAWADVSIFDAWDYVSKPFKAQPSELPDTHHVNIISPKSRVHILYGDRTGGGHMFGQNKPCKSEFPKGWDEARILNTIGQIAANDNINWRREGNGYYTGQQNVDGVKVRVVLNRERDDVITAYPVNGRRNPCPANDN